MSIVGVAQVWRRTPRLNSAFSARSIRRFAAVPTGGLLCKLRVRAGAPAVIRFALAIGASPMLETARIGGDAGSL
jgi:hypothetical protein